MAKDAYYFSHDSNARYDPDICDMRTAYGSEGYGWYWMLVEMLREQTDYKLKLCKCNAYAMQMQCERNAVEKFINDCINQFNLFQTDGENFWSDSLLRRMKHKEEKSEKARQAAASRWGSERNADAMQTQCERNAIKESKIKEIKVKIVKKQYADFVSLSESEYQKLVDEHGEDLAKHMVEILDNYKGSSGKKYKDDYRAILNWVVKRVQEEQTASKKPTPQQGQAKAVDPKFDLLSWGKFGEGGN